MFQGSLVPHGHFSDFTPLRPTDPPLPEFLLRSIRAEFTAEAVLVVLLITLELFGTDLMDPSHPLVKESEDSDWLVAGPSYYSISYFILILLIVINSSITKKKM